MALVPVTAPIPGSIESALAPSVSHASVAVPPAGTVSGSAPKARISLARTVTVTAALAAPKAFDALSV